MQRALLNCEGGASISDETIHNLRFADDIDLVAQSGGAAAALKCLATRVNDSSNRFGLKINIQNYHHW